MADSTENLSRQNEQGQSSESEDDRLANIKKDMEGWREVLIPLNKLLNWEKPYYPAIIVGFTTFVFMLIWYFEPSVLTTFSLIGLFMCIIDFIVPMVGPMLYSNTQWTVVQEQEFEQICIRLWNAKVHFNNFKETMSQLKTEKPKVYFIVVMGMLILFAWIGSLFDNMLLTYLIVNVALLQSGLRRHAVVRKYIQKGKAILDRTVLNKSKTN
ncbi:ADP-ribosylation factor-like protein 6-interacting protein 1 [Gigantopelta aegis]|uniref:ADP-ribosylation factor-like protein 6-interacting protein 1 n=1 Tax=Gigantopelta aegis TaxID=1735272 RepID=UPI001B888132|nr:ADP-ribosylation factor-like protein 6-interacting protein 1 [Gigantopelta aegis]